MVFPVFKTVGEFKSYLKEENINCYNFMGHEDFDYDIYINLENFLSLIKTEDISTIFENQIDIDYDFFMLDPNSIGRNYDCPSHLFKKYLISKFEDYNNDVEIDESQIGETYSVILFTSFNGLKICSSISLELGFTLPDLDEIATSIYETALIDFEEINEDYIKEKQNGLEELEKYLTSDPMFKKLKNDALRRNYLENLKLTKPDIFSLFKYTSTPRNPLYQLNAYYQLHKQ